MRSFLVGTCTVALLAVFPAVGWAQNAAEQNPPAESAPAAQQSVPPADAQAPAGQDTGSADASSEGTDDEHQGPIDFEGGKITITGADDSEKTVAYDGKTLASNYQVRFDKIVKVQGVNVAIIDVGDGGNQCGPATLLVWKPEGGAIKSKLVEQDDCGAPPPAVAENSIYFVPYLLPGESNQSWQWAPDSGLQISGRLSYIPDPGTDWKDVDPSKYQNIIDSFHNEAVYKAAQKLLGKDMTDMATSLLVGGGTEKMPSGAFYATGCIPHACGGGNGFMAVDVKKKALYFAKQGEHPQPDTWPALKTWPPEMRDALKKALGDWE
jgi:hypothetical protein